MTIDNIVFGNPSLRDYNIMRRENFLDRLIPELKRFDPPKNSSNAAIQELNMLAELISQKRNKNDNAYDEQLLTLIKQVFTDAGAEKEVIETVVNSIGDDVIPLITKLKYHFNRPRPQQLSFYYNMNFFPDFSYFTNSPSYPSGHVALTFITCHVLGNIYPDSFQKVANIVKNVKESRLFLGVHYPSDNDMAVIVSKAVLNEKEFKIKYRL